MRERGGRWGNPCTPRYFQTMFLLKSSQARPLETPLEFGDPNWTGVDLQGDLPGSCGSGEGPRAFGGELYCVLGGRDGGQLGGESKLGMAKEMDSILHRRFTTLNPSW